MITAIALLLFLHCIAETAFGLKTKDTGAAFAGGIIAILDISAGIYLLV